jgi:hypothetical protein
MIASVKQLHSKGPACNELLLLLVVLLLAGA